MCDEHACMTKITNNIKYGGSWKIRCVTYKIIDHAKEKILKGNGIWYK